MDFREYLEITEDYLTKIDNQHPFYYYLQGLTYNMFDEEVIGYYNKDNQEVHFYTKDPSKLGNIYHHGWINFNKTEKVKIYSKYCSSYYESNEYNIDEKQYYKYLIDILLNKIIN
jgi:hypothetical protein